MTGHQVHKKYIPLLGEAFMNWVVLRDPESTTRFVSTPQLDLEAGRSYALIKVQVTCNTIHELEKGNLLLVDRNPGRDEILANDLVVLPIPPKLAKYKMVENAQHYITRHTPGRRTGEEWKILRVISAEELQEAADSD